jgi:integrase
MNTVIQLRPSRSEKPTVRGGRAKNADYRQREYLTEAEIDKLVAAAGDSRNPIRDRLLVLMAFRHALRVSELVGSAGSKSILIPRPSTLPAPRTARLATTAYRVTSCGCCGRFVGSIRTQISYSLRA